MELNSIKTLEIPVKDAYGPRDTNKIERVPTKKLRNANLDPRVGNRVQISGKTGTIIMSGGGRTRIDFNHPLAGKDLVFDVTVTEQITDDDQIRKEIISRRFPGVNFDDITIEVTENPKTITISLPNYLIFMEGLAISKYTLGTDLHEFLDFELVKFQDIFDYQKKEEEESSSEEKVSEDTDS